MAWSSWWRLLQTGRCYSFTEPMVTVTDACDELSEISCWHQYIPHDQSFLFCNNSTSAINDFCHLDLGNIFRFEWVISVIKILRHCSIVIDQLECKWIKDDWACGSVCLYCLSGQPVSKSYSTKPVPCWISCKHLQTLNLAILSCR